MKKTTLFFLTLALSLSLTACSGQNQTPTAAETKAASEETEATEKTETTVAKEAASLEGHTLNIYCGAGMTKPFQKIADTFKEETGCEMAITFANAGQIQAQINTAQEGDLFIAGSEEELKPVQEAVSASVKLVKHIPVLAVQSQNPKGITGLSDLENPELRVVLGDAESTPIGKIANKALTDAGILEKVNVVARTTTAPAIITALTQDECDAAIVWKENIGEGVEMIDTPDMEPYIKTVPAASLTYCADDDALNAFLDYLASDTAKKIWSNAGYEILN